MGIVKLSSRESNHYGPHQQCAREPCQYCATEERMNCISLLTFAFSYEIEHTSIYWLLVFAYFPISLLVDLSLFYLKALYLSES